MSRPTQAIFLSPPALKKRRFSQTESGSDLRETGDTRPRYAVEVNPYDSPRQITPVALRISIGPTPQRNGQVLGLFDMLSPPSIKPLPSGSAPPVHGSIDGQATPSKRKAVETLLALTATPSRRFQPSQNSTARKNLDGFSTPTKPRSIGKLTPSSQKAKFDATPEFLRREAQCIPINYAGRADGCNSDAGTPFSPISVRMTAKPVGKALSALVKGLKAMEEDELDDELDVLRELEEEEAGHVSNAVQHKPQILVEGTQTVETTDLPLGADGDHTSSEDEEEKRVDPGALGFDGKPRKIYKKKGQKRTTKKSKIKPSAAKWKPEPVWEAGKDDEHRSLEHQQAEGKMVSGDLETGEKAGDEKGTNKKNDASTKKGRKSGKFGVLAHTNFRALKLRNKSSGGRNGGRFGRRR